MDRFARLFMIVLVLWLAAILTAQEDTLQVGFQEKLLATIPEGLDEFSTPIFSPDYKRVAYSAKKGKKYFIVIGNHRRETHSIMLVTLSLVQTEIKWPIGQRSGKNS